MEWIKDRNPTKKECEEAGDVGFIVCISGYSGNQTYDHAIHMGDCFFENDKWYIDGCIGTHEKITIHGFMIPPTWSKDEITMA